MLHNLCLFLKYCVQTPTGKIQAGISGPEDKWSLVDLNKELNMNALEDSWFRAERQDFQPLTVPDGQKRPRV